MGGDCGERLCMAGISWVTTGKGDVNGDGDRHDATTYAPDQAFTGVALPFLRTQSNPGGDWESWPATFNTVGGDEGHFVMECANKGICDRDSGECDCFPGYEGAGCRRQTCHEQCHEHGVCATVAKQAALSGLEYKLWDATMSRACLCDPGYEGPVCEHRSCPLGDDPLTMDGQHSETQWVDVYATGGALGGSVSLGLQTHTGETFVTDPVPLAPLPYAGASAAALQAALRTLPWTMPATTVTASACEEVIQGNVQIVSGVLSPGTNNGVATASRPLDSTLGYVRFPGVATDSLHSQILRLDNTGTLIHDNGDPATTTDVDDATLHSVSEPYCVRFKVEFHDMSGDVPDLLVDTSLVTASMTHAACWDPSCGILSNVVTLLQGGGAFLAGDTVAVRCGATVSPSTVVSATATEVTLSGGVADCTASPSNEVSLLVSDVSGRGQQTAAASGLTGIGHRVTDQLRLAQTGFATDATFVFADTKSVTASCSYASGTCSISKSNQEILLDSGGDAFYPYEAVHVSCNNVPYGTFTVAGTVAPTSTSLVVLETIADCTAGTILVTLATNRIVTTADLTHVLGVGDWLSIDTFSPVQHSVDVVLYDPTSGLGRLLLSGDHDGNEGCTAPDSDTCDESVTLPATGHAVQWAGKGTTEANPCSDRGVCDYDSGECKCFPGYTGLSCDLQHAVAM